MTKSRILTLQQLKDVQACKPHIRFFKRTFGDKTRISESLVIKYWNKFDWDWAAKYLLSAQAWEQYQKTRPQTKALAVREQDDKAAISAWELYWKTMARVWARLYINDGATK